MRLSLFTVVLACMIAAVIADWSKEDQEIFRLREEVERTEGEGVTFYEFLGCKTTCNQEEINKAYKKRARVLHPDKVKQKFIADTTTGKDKPKNAKKKPGVHVSKGPTKKQINAAAKAASDRFARLGIVTNILRGEGRARYDHFLSNGFPKWKGNGYFYERFRPGFFSVVIMLFMVGGGLIHWLAQYLQWYQDQNKMQKYIDFARGKAWGDNLVIPGVDGTENSDDEEDMQPTNRRQRRMMEARKDKSERKTKGVKAAKITPVGTPPVGIVGPKKRVVAENGRVLVVDQPGNVYLEQVDDDGVVHEFLLDPKVVPVPTIKSTALYRLPVWVVGTITSRFSKKAPTEEEFEEGEVEEVASSSSGADDFEDLGKEVKRTAQNGNGRLIKRKKSSRR